VAQKIALAIKSGFQPSIVTALFHFVQFLHRIVVVFGPKAPNALFATVTFWDKIKNARLDENVFGKARLFKAHFGEIDSTQCDQCCRTNDAQNRQDQVTHKKVAAPEMSRGQNAENAVDHVKRGCPAGVVKGGVKS